MSQFTMVTPEDYHDFELELDTQTTPVAKKRGRPPKADGASRKKKARTDMEGSTKGKAKARAKKAAEEDVDELDVIGSDEEKEIEEHHVKVLMYVNVETPPPPPVRVAGRVTKLPGPKITVRGPFAFQSNISYADFLSIVAKGVGTRSANCIVRAEMQWRFDRPANAAKRPVTNEEGYEAMITTILTKSKDYAITVSIPPPTKHVDDVVSFVTYATSQLVSYSCRLSSLGPWLPLMRMMVTTDSQ
jgi:hypothetical protein